jgi:hypothetical protein
MQQEQQNINNRVPLSPESDISGDSIDSYSEAMVNGKKTYSCLASNCGKVFKFKSEIKRHIIIHSKERPFECTFPGCKKTFKRTDALGNHIKLHERPSPYDCPIAGCKVQLNTKAGLQYHLSKHGEDEEIYRCNFPACNQTFLTYKHLSQHERNTHYPNGPAQMLTMKKPQMMVSAPMASFMDDGMESYMYGNKKRAMQSYLPVQAVKYEKAVYEDDTQSEGLTMKTYSDSADAVQDLKAEFNEEVVTGVLPKPAFIQPPTLNFEDNIKNALICTLAENQKLKKELMFTMKFLQGNIVTPVEARNQTYVTSAYKSLIEPEAHQLAGHFHF